MKKVSILCALILCLFLVGCRANQPLKNQKESTSTDKTETITIIEENPYMIMYDGHLYYDTGETNSQPRCGVMDFTLEYTGSLDKTPTKDNQANFKSAGGQIPPRKNRLEVVIDEVWHIFAYNENDIENVAMTILDNTNTSVSLEISNDSDCEIIYGEEFTLEKKDEETGEWYTEYPITDNYAFNEIAYIVKPGDASMKPIDLEWLYGELEDGTYRIIKTISTSNETETHWYSAQFSVKK